MICAATRRRRLEGVPPRTPSNNSRASGGFSTVRNIKSASSLAHGASTCAFDLLTGLFIRAIHRMALIPAPPRPPAYFLFIPVASLKRLPWRYICHFSSDPQFAISNPLRLSRMALRLAHLICSLASRFAPFTGRCSSRAPPTSCWRVSH